MTEYKSEFLKTLDSRGFIKQMTHAAELDSYCASGIPVCYIGFDATADSLHVGSLLQIMMLHHFQRSGGKPVVLMGGGTTKVGDPTDKEKSRPLLTDAQIASNMAGIKKAFEPFLKFGDGPTDAIMVNNDDWLSKIGYVEFLRDYGVHFTINTMIKQETVDRRLRNEQPYTFLEFNYMLLQAYDFLELYRRHGVRLQLGGSDQWGNIINGVELTRRVAGGDAYGLTSHLITTASGGKMGKTADGAVWLNADRKSPYEYWQFWRNTEDADVGRFLRLFTDLDVADIAELEKLEGADINTAKIALANAATTLLHGADVAAESEAAATAVFADGASADALPTVEVPKAELEAGMLVAAAFAAAGLAASNGEARRLIKQGAAKVNDALVSDQNGTLGMADLIDGSIKLSAGKKRHALLKIS
ncbi:MAG: tyrosine--tRNA ligase [Alphaproteobacteria bacterium]|nr:tyrosine--tRNA ligase [Alphaproteobacteria bacterium]MBU2083298.1 tyrosine--tRNA ligase [Alphaproteobacteria bacterium]MBU2143737.1 tyrosine--tRNA ligase [Alphaproteobacteria bacterium]MBU2195582.1 tyrosine--tRNA ligase [Alphaproteobacteria bacterium]